MNNKLSLITVHYHREGKHFTAIQIAARKAGLILSPSHRTILISVFVL